MCDALKGPAALPPREGNLKPVANLCTTDERSSPLRLQDLRHVHVFVSQR